MNFLAVFWKTLQTDGVSFPLLFLLSFCKLTKQAKKIWTKSDSLTDPSLAKLCHSNSAGGCVSWVFHNSRAITWRSGIKKSLVGLIWDDKTTTDRSFAVYCNLQQSMEPAQEQTVPEFSNINKNTSLFSETVGENTAGLLDWVQEPVNFYITDI